MEGNTNSCGAVNGAYYEPREKCIYDAIYQLVFWVNLYYNNDRYIID